MRVAVVFGGRSSEHGVSVLSAGSVMRALDPREYEVIAVGITASGRWVLADPGQRLSIDDRVLPEVARGAPVVLPADPSVAGLLPLGDGAGGDPLAELRAVDVVFPILHGPYGEDGTIQGLLEMAGIPYVGSGVFASAAGMDKEYTKKLMRAEGLRVGDFAVLRRPPDAPIPEAAPAGTIERLGLPVFVKPARAGSSIGISKVADLADLPAALALAFDHDDKVLIEAAVAGREIECGVLEGASGPIASLPAEIRMTGGRDWYDFDAKYLDDATEIDLPADLPAALTERIRAIAVRAFQAIGAAGLARVDFFVPPDGEPVINEINTMPGFTPISMYPQMWAATGIDYPQLVRMLIDAALRRAGASRP
ncbi:MAG: D-alanine--D-alanine ligase [Frankiaceae bacterium]|jgi:D-alanine-D-alanine ligase|nr:D-alanine--D-alanine ligase [Frankiaceae bacterium]